MLKAQPLPWAVLPTARSGCPWPHSAWPSGALLTVAMCWQRSHHEAGRERHIEGADGRTSTDPPLLSPQTFGSAVGHFTQSAFHLDATRALTGTSAGKVVVWDVERKRGLAKEPQGGLHGMKATKLVPLQEESVTVLMVLER